MNLRKFVDNRKITEYSVPDAIKRLETEKEKLRIAILGDTDALSESHHQKVFKLREIIEQIDNLKTQANETTI